MVISVFGLVDAGSIPAAREQGFQLGAVFRGDGGHVLAGRRLAVVALVE